MRVLKVGAGTSVSNVKNYTRWVIFMQPPKIWSLFRDWVLSIVEEEQDHRLIAYRSNGPDKLQLQVHGFENQKEMVYIKEKHDQTNIKYVSYSFVFTQIQ